MPTVAAGRGRRCRAIGTLATRLEALPLDTAADVLVLVEPALAAFERQAALAVERAPIVS